MSAPTYRFLPWARRGIAAAITTTDTLGSGVPRRASLPVTLRLDEADDVEIRPEVALYGPGDVTAVDRLQIIRTDPPPFATGVDTTVFPAVEFAVPELPWIFSPAAADDQGRLRPWLCLIIVPAVAGTEPQPGTDGRPPSVTVPVAQLPDLSESWAWAHVQILVDDEDADIGEVLARRPDRAVSRLLCPRRLDPNTAYRGFVVPAFETGRMAGLGHDGSGGDGELRPAWTTGAGPATVNLPIYHQWEFATGAAGDFESLLGLLRARSLPAGVGTRRVRVSDLPADLPDAGILPFGGALRPPARDAGDEADASPALAAALRDLLNRPADADEAESAVGPPIYGRWQAAHDVVPADGEAPRWLGELNVDPRHRAAAACGALVVADQQRQLMASAWEQVGRIEDANQLLRQAQLAREAGRSVHRRLLAQLSADELFLLTGPVHSRARLSPETVGERTRRSRLPTAATSAAFRRVVRPRGPLARRHDTVEGHGDTPATGDGAPVSLLDGLADGSLTASPPRSNPRIIDAPEHILSAGEIEEADGASGVAPGQRPAGFEDAIDDDRDHFASVLGVTAPDPGPALALANVGPTLLARLDPDATAAHRAQVRVRGRPTPPTDPLGPVMAAPTFPHPMYEALADLSQDFLVPGLADVPANTVTLLETNPAFIEAFMVGLNHEMSRELLWREYPTDQRGTYFRHFWTGGGSPSDRSRLMHEWDALSALGGNHPDAAGTDHLVLLVRGDLLQRYPNAIIYAVRAVQPPDSPRRQLTDTERYPLFEAGMEPDVTLVGFDLTAELARSGPDDDPGWFFVIQRQPTEPHFGLDPPSHTDTDRPASWAKLSWSHVAENSDPPRHAPVGGTLAGVRIDDLEWGVNAAHMAAVTLQQPIRMAIHADDLLPTSEPD